MWYLADNFRVKPFGFWSLYRCINYVWLRACHFLDWTVIAGDCSKTWSWRLKDLKDGQADMARITEVYQTQQSSKGEIYWLHDTRCKACIRELYRGIVTSLNHICTYVRASLNFWKQGCGCVQPMRWTPKGEQLTTHLNSGWLIHIFSWKMWVHGKANC